MKKIFALFLLLTFLSGCSCSSGIKENKSPAKNYENEVAKIMQIYPENPETAKTTLKALDTELITAPATNVYRQPDKRSAEREYRLSVYSFRKADSDLIYLQWLLIPGDDKHFSGPLDYVSLEWDADYASYYASSGDETISTVQGRNTGIVLFNMEDNKLGKEKITYGTVQVTGKENETIPFGSKFTHTYAPFSISGSAPCSFAPSDTINENGEESLGLSHIMGYTVAEGRNIAKWVLWTESALNFS